ncbi:hypothetical protein DAPK24_052690 [Pichia kluyveri]|uniref:Tubulin-specific chaperone A n=1 Tax=Pichia kluyveri TaxID=36015 RepID=A0AAV5RDJ0_PICKL|nr:hypothetical protein DAPK24_052690 [Pichia kluyveri]
MNMTPTDQEIKITALKVMLRERERIVQDQQARSEELIKMKEKIDNWKLESSQEPELSQFREEEIYKTEKTVFEDTEEVIKVAGIQIQEVLKDVESSLEGAADEEVIKLIEEAKALDVKET